MEPGSLQLFILKVFLVNCCLGLVSSLYFHMAEGEQKCFIQEIPADTVVVGHLLRNNRRIWVPPIRCIVTNTLYPQYTKGETWRTVRRLFIDKNREAGDYWTQLYDEQKHEYLPATRNLTLSVAGRTPTDKLILSHKETKGRFNFTSFTSGEHKICLQPSLSQPLTAGFMVVVHMDIRSGERTNNYTEIQKREQLTQLQLRIRQLSAQVHHIQKEHIYRRSRGKDFFAINHNINMWIYWWPIIRSVFVVTVIISITNSC